MNLKQSGYQSVSVKDELRANLIKKLRAGEKLFRGIVGYDETVIPQLVNAILARHNIILLGLRGQAKSRIIRQLTELLDDKIPIVAGSEVNDDPFHPISAYGRQTLAVHGDSTHIDWVGRDSRFVEKLATPDVTIADIIGDVDPIKAAKGGHLLERRADDSLWAAATRQPRHLRYQRAAGSRRQDSGRPLQHHAGRRRAD